MTDQTKNPDHLKQNLKDVLQNIDQVKKESNITHEVIFPLFFN